MAISVFKFRNYKKYLNDWIAEQPKNGHGVRKKFADAIGTQTGFITQVLSGEAHFSFDQIFVISKLIGHTPEEKRFFFLLLQLDRAGNSEAKSFLKQEIEQAWENRRDLTKKFETKSLPSTAEHTQYFSSYLYACVHIMTTIDRFSRSRAEIAKALHQPLERINEILEFLLRTNIISEEKGRLNPGTARLHIGKHSPYISQHHTNWNLLTLAKILENPALDTHYSSVASVSQADKERIQELFAQALEASKKIISASEGEVVCAITLNVTEIC